jgi:hypothetical protein
MTMMMTNRALFTLSPTMWNAPADIGAGLLLGSSVPGALTAAAVKDLNFIDALLALTGVDEPTDGSYARVNPITLGTAVEDDTNDRVNYPMADVDFGALTASQVYAIFFYVDGASDAARVLLAVDTFASAQTANGAGFVYRTGGAAGTDDVFRLGHA